MNRNKECELVMLETNKQNNQITMYLNEELIPDCLSLNKDLLKHHRNQHLFVISDDDIEVNDWVFCRSNALSKHIDSEKGNYLNTILKVIEITPNQLYVCDSDGVEHYYLDINKCKKVIASTDDTINEFKIPISFINIYINEWNKRSTLKYIPVKYFDDSEYHPELDYNQTEYWSYPNIDSNGFIIINYDNIKWNFNTINELRDYINRLKNTSFECWSEVRMNAYLTACISIEKKIEKMMSSGGLDN
jgi:hypothetical protein